MSTRKNVSLVVLADILLHCSYAACQGASETRSAVLQQSERGGGREKDAGDRDRACGSRALDWNVEMIAQHDTTRAVIWLTVNYSRAASAAAVAPATISGSVSCRVSAKRRHLSVLLIIIVGCSLGYARMRHEAMHITSGLLTAAQCQVLRSQGGR